MRRTFVVAGVSAGLLLGTPAAFAAETPTGPMHKPPFPYLTANPKTVHPGDRFVVSGRCFRNHRNTDVLLATVPEIKEVSKQVTSIGEGNLVKATFEVSLTAKPGDYRVGMLCDAAEPDVVVHVVPRQVAKEATKQVAKVPAGAPQTGGTDGPADGSGTPLAAAAGMGVLAAGGAGLVLARRARRR
ncbi:hypothetical protein [Amycolatopsis australiensis]|uniref:Gram-positive cocci surface proteins LPxTG domain-containing protein n=1 Tax=Amycolatopsis australiensis TaxID=546364 RepID=A0A1K1P8Y3_9PSEU|nr:hypothetical protein [Amycolatopsis australiensis]SFW43945.1 hypothetical protein SAMN04489730_0341 [Amycolatopsis australiensis]